MDGAAGEAGDGLSSARNEYISGSAAVGFAVTGTIETRGAGRMVEPFLAGGFTEELRGITVEVEGGDMPSLLP